MTIHSLLQNAEKIFFTGVIGTTVCRSKEMTARRDVLRSHVGIADLEAVLVERVTCLNAWVSAHQSGQYCIELCGRAP